MRHPGRNNILTLESEGGNMHFNGKFVDAVYGVKGLRSLKRSAEH